MSALECSEYDAFIMSRGAITSIMQLPFTSLEWSRVVDDISTATIEVAGKLNECATIFKSVKPWKHELGIYRNGTRCWAGPLTNKAITDKGIAFSGRDIMSWTKRRRLRNDHVYVGMDLSTIFNLYVTDAMSVDNSPRLRVNATPCGVVGDRTVLAAQYRMCWDQLRELADTGVDFTVVDRAVIIGGFDLSDQLAPLPTLTDGAFVSIETIEVQGDPLVTDQIVIGDGFGERGATIVGRSTVASGEFGVHESVLSRSEIKDNDSATRSARTITDLQSKPMLVISGGQLASNAPVSVEDLIPGRAVRIAINELAEQVQGIYRLVAVAGSTGPEHDRISITVQPIGSTSLNASAYDAQSGEVGIL